MTNDYSGGSVTDLHRLPRFRFIFLATDYNKSKTIVLLVFS